MEHLDFSFRIVNDMRSFREVYRYSPGALTLMVYLFSGVPATLFVSPFLDENSTSEKV